MVVSQAVGEREFAERQSLNIGRIKDQYPHVVQAAPRELARRDQVIDEEIRICSVAVPSWCSVVVGSRPSRRCPPDPSRPPLPHLHRAPASPSDATVVEEIIARINNSIISLSDLKRSEEQLAAEASKADPNAPAENQPQQKDLLRDLIDTKLLSQKAKELGISADTDVIKRLDELRKQMHAESMEDLEKAAQAQGVSFEEFKQNMKDSILTQKVIQQEVGAHISVTQQEIQDFYDQHKAEMQRPEQVRLSEILISTQAAAGAGQAAPQSLQ